MITDGNVHDEMKRDFYKSLTLISVPPSAERR